MLKKIKDVVMRWRDKPNNENKLDFEYKKKAGDKSFKASIFSNDKDTTVIELISFKGYTEKYVKHKLSYYFNKFNVPLQDNLSSGDIIFTRYQNTNPLAVDIVISLPPDTYYYAVNDGLIYCNGEQLGRQCKAIYLSTLIDRCSLDSEPTQYTKFKLQ